MIRFLLLFAILVSSTTCSQPEPQKTFLGDKQFRTTPPSRLYFNNVRSVYYYKERKPNTKIDLFTLRKMYKGNAYPILIPRIINNWMKDEAYIFLENNAYPQFSDSVMVQWEHETIDSLKGTYLMTRRTKKQQYEFAGKLFESLTNAHELSIQNEQGEWIPFFDNFDDRMNYIATLKDYYKLTEVY